MLFNFLLCLLILPKLLVIESVSGANSVSAHGEEEAKSPDECPICLGTFTDSLVLLNCSHVFHKHCIDEWKEIQTFCPLCKSAIEVEKIREIILETSAAKDQMYEVVDTSKDFMLNGNDTKLINFYPFSEEQLAQGWDQFKMQQHILNDSAALCSKYKELESILYRTNRLIESVHCNHDFVLIQRTKVLMNSSQKALENKNMDSTDLIEMLVTMTNRERELVIVPYLCRQFEHHELPDRRLKAIILEQCKVACNRLEIISEHSVNTLLHFFNKKYREDFFYLKHVNMILTWTNFSKLREMFDELWENYNIDFLTSIQELNRDRNDQFLQFVEKIAELTMNNNLKEEIKELKEKEEFTSFLCYHVLDHRGLKDRYKDIMQLLCNTKRDSSFQINQTKADLDATSLSNYFSRKKGEKEHLNRVIQILTQENYSQLRATFRAFKEKNYGEDIVGRVRNLNREGKVHFLQVIEAIAMEVQKGRPHFFAMVLKQKVEKLLNSKKGHADAHNGMKRILLSRVSVDLPQIMDVFGTVYTEQESIPGLRQALELAMSQSKKEKNAFAAYIKIVEFAEGQEAIAWD